MNKFEETERLKIDRKLLKPQVERRRRERMNRSLENLRILLLQGPEQQAMSQRRVEKAEILEHTVLFLQSSITEAKKSRPEGPDESSPEGHQFRDGFSACLQKAARFLQEESEARGLHNSLSSSLYHCLSRPHWHSARDARQCHGTQGLQCVRRHTHTLSHPYRIPPQHTDPNTAHRHHYQNTAGTAQPTASPQAAGRQCVWRPWP
ncbi:transcription factor HES-7.1-like [Ictalurus punctatus]|uniref:Transcription factor HES-7.1 n=1 Tax=Ictalurus punctatus TaxID=7998 RepID=A0A2D0QBK1_ICTPU|nr:transcription factor HES-7.1 [Ictalurus punctatus]XP_053535251.1 transcription factor HES-7.1-like [Ictalurus punctatus]